MDPACFFRCPFTSNIFFYGAFVTVTGKADVTTFLDIIIVLWMENSTQALTIFRYGSLFRSQFHLEEPSKNNYDRLNIDRIHQNYLYYLQI